jgi:hypothetical protein
MNATQTQTEILYAVEILERGGPNPVSLRRGRERAAKIVASFMGVWQEEFAAAALKKAAGFPPSGKFEEIAYAMVCAVSTSPSTTMLHGRTGNLAAAAAIRFDEPNS